MQLYRHFDELIYDANALPVPRDSKENLIAALRYLRTQTLCDQDRRDKRANYKEAWERVEFHFKNLEFRNRFKKSDEFYEPIYKFVGYGKFEIRYVPPVPRAADPSRYAEWSPEQILAEMLSDSSGVGRPRDKISLRENLSFSS